MSVPPRIDVPAIGPWQRGTVVEIRSETARVKTFRLALPHPTPHMAGQHFLIRLTAPDGYRAQRSYSVASPPDNGGEIELTIERLPDGEVSTFVHDDVVVGDTLEVRGPIGGWFVWDGATPALLIGGGSGVVPLMSMLRLARRVEGQSLANLLVSVRSPDDLIYAAEMLPPDATVIYTRTAPPTSKRAAARISIDDLIPLERDGATVFICGSARFTEAASALVVDLGVQPSDVRIERFGPTG